ncbi:unnamed protein product, partial [Ascophyllum nodosum]
MYDSRFGLGFICISTVVCIFSSFREEFSPPLTCRRSSCPPPSPKRRCRVGTRRVGHLWYANTAISEALSSFCLRRRLLIFLGSYTPSFH